MLDGDCGDHPLVEQYADACIKQDYNHERHKAHESGANEDEKNGSGNARLTVQNLLIWIFVFALANPQKKG